MNHSSLHAEPIIWLTGVNGMIGSAICREFGRAYRLIGLEVESPHEHLEELAKR